MNSQSTLCHVRRLENLENWKCVAGGIQSLSFRCLSKYLELYTRAMNTMLDHVRCHYEVADQEEEVVRQGTEIFQKI